jgi:hypothetical protein
VTLFEMLSGQLPYPPGTVEQTFRRHESGAPANIRRLTPLLPPGLAVLVDRLLARRPGARPRAALVVQQLVNLEIAALRRRQSA